MDHPEDYRWNSLGYHIQTSNKDDFLSLDFGLKEFRIVDSEERLKRYGRYVYEAGGLDISGKPGTGVIDNSVLEKERKNDFELKRVQRFRYTYSSISEPDVGNTFHLAPIALSVFPVQTITVSDTRSPCNRFNFRDFVNDRVLPVSLSSLNFFSGGRQLFNQKRGRLIFHNSRASICQDRGIVRRNVAVAF